VIKKVYLSVVAVAVCFASLLGCGSGSASSGQSTTAPSNLIYPQATISATVGKGITPDTPTVAGTVSSYSISPPLPAGLTFDTLTGSISGTPTAVAAQTTYTVTATNSGGSATATVQITVKIAPPSNLVYPQTTISVNAGSAITPDMPTVAGAPTSYSISPALPAGLSLNASTGLIAGTPTTVANQTAYTITAANSSGSTTTTVKITVNPAAPSNLIYPQTAISASIGSAITPDIPSVTGTVSSYSVSPTLPTGLSLDASTGVISGTPTASVAQTAFTITAGNSGGNTTSNVTIAVVQAQNALLELGQTGSIETLRFEGGRVLSADYSGHWALWNYTSGALLANGDGAGVSGLVDMAGQTVVVGIQNGLEIRDQSDGHVLSLIVYPGLNPPGMNYPGYNPLTWWKLASDGGYVCIGSKSGLFVYTLTGQLAVSKPGDYYSKVLSFAASGNVLIARGPAGQNVIETISAVDGTSSVGPTLSGQFNSWFLDGSRFLTNEGNTVSVYSSAGVQQAIVALPDIANLTGQGNWIWTYDAYALGYPLEIYPIGSSTPAFSYDAGVDTAAIASGQTIGLLSYGSGQVSVIDLSGSTPSQTNSSVAVAYLSEFASASSAQWVIGNRHGAIADGASLSSTPRYFGHGAAWSIAGASGSVAISTAIGQILVFDPSASLLKQTIDFSSGKLALSSDGTVLGAFANANDAQYEPDRTLNFYSLPSATVIASFPYTFQLVSPVLTDFTLAASGSTIGQVIALNDFSSYTRQVTPITGAPLIWSDTGNSNPILLSPDGTLIAEYNTPGSTSSATNIFKNGSVVAAVPGAAVGWIDNNRLLVNLYQDSGPPMDTVIVYAGCAIYSATGVQLSTPALPELQSIQSVNSDSVYDPSHNAIYSLTTGQPIWTASFPGVGVGTVAGPYVVYESGHSVVIETF